MQIELLSQQNWALSARKAQCWRGELKDVDTPPYFTLVNKASSRHVCLEIAGWCQYSEEWETVQAMHTCVICWSFVSSVHRNFLKFSWVDTAQIWGVSTGMLTKWWFPCLQREEYYTNSVEIIYSSLSEAFFCCTRLSTVIYLWWLFFLRVAWESERRRAAWRWMLHFLAAAQSVAVYWYEIGFYCKWTSRTDVFASLQPLYSYLWKSQS